MSAAALFEERTDPGRVSSALLAAAVHAVLLAVLVFGVSWQNRPPESIAAELWEPPTPAPVPEAPKLPPKVEPAPPPQPEPVIQKPEIAEKAPPKPAPNVQPKPKAEPPKDAAKPRDHEAQRQIREQLAREQASLAVDRERQHIRDQLARE